MSEIKLKPVTNNAKSRRCDFRNAECAALGKTINKVWVCENHLPGNDFESQVEQLFNEIDARAQELMLADNKVSGKHYAAMRLIFEEKFGRKWK